MKKLLSTIAFTLVGIHASLFATARPAPCNFAFTGEWVYYTPLALETLYATVIGSGVNFGGSPALNDPSYGSGFRVQGMYAFENCFTDSRFAWTYFFDKSRDSVDAGSLTLAPTAQGGSPIIATIANGSAESQLKFTLSRVEGVFGLHVFDRCGLSMTFEGGLQYSRIDLDTKFLYNDPANPPDPRIAVKYDSRYWGIGPQVGIDLNYSLCGDFSFVGMANTALLVGENKASFLDRVNNVTDAALATSFSTPWRIVQSMQMRCGFSYLLCGWQIEAGYEFLNYFNGVEFLEPRGTTNGSLTQVTQDIGFHGPYASASFCF